MSTPEPAATPRDPTATPDERPEGSVAGRLLAVARRVQRPVPPRFRRPLLVLATVGLAVAAVLAVRDLDIAWSQLDWTPLLLAMLLGVPASTVVNGLEFVLAGWGTGRRVGVRVALQVTILGSAANLLPLPGATLVRWRALQRDGVAGVRAGVATLVVALAWVAVSCLLAGVTLALTGHVFAAVPFLAGGVVAEVVSVLGARHAAEPGRAAGFAAWAVAVELASVATIALRLGLLLAALRMDPGLAEPLVLAVSVALAAALGVFPGGLGINEGLSALLAPLVGLPVAVGFLVAALNRVIGLVVLVPVAAALGVAGRVGEASRDPASEVGGGPTVSAPPFAGGSRTSTAEEPSGPS